MKRMIALWLLCTGLLWAQAPAISNVAVSNITPTSFTVSWTTDVAADTFVGWGDNYYNVDAGASDTSTGVTSHSQTITGLHPGKGYLYVIRSRAFTAGAPDDSKAAFYQAPSNITTSAAPSTGSFDYWLEVKGPHHVTQGQEMYLWAKAGALAGTSNYTNGTYKVIVTNLPPYTAVHWTDQEYNGLGQGTRSTTNVANDTLTSYSLGSAQIALTTNQGGTTPAGTYTVHVTTQTNNGTGPAKDVSWTMIVDAPSTLTQATPSSYPAIPELATWQSQMTTYGAKWCLSTGAGGNEQAVWYYDGLNVFYRISDYTKDAETWAACITSVKADYRNYVVAASGAIPGYRVFPHGLYTDYLRAGDTTSKDAVHMLADTLNLQSGAVPLVDARNVRETAYSLNANRLDNKLGNDRSVQIRQLVNLLLGDIDQIVNGGAEWYQPFMCGLLAEALIGYYEDGNTDDARIPVAIKALADHLYANDWNHADYEAGAFIYNSYQQSIGMKITDGSEMKGLNLLIAPMYAWLYKLTGDATYQTEGDAIFQQGVTAPVGATVNWSGKNFSQNYRWSFDYVNWRSQPAASRKRVISGGHTLGGSRTVQ